jgi:uncharacterized protein YeaO (DUF488 family)
MIKVKHFMDAVEPDDGARIWVEPFGLTADLCQMCEVEHVFSHLGPPPALWRWLEDHPMGYEYFRARYHGYLTDSPLVPALQEIANTAAHENVTLLHQGSDAEWNTAMALYEFLSELSAYCPPNS